MIVIERRGGRIDFYGQADSATYGQDVICAAVSGASLALACVADDAELSEDGKVLWVRMGKRRAAAAMSLFLKLAHEHPDFVRTTRY
jgi:uncharacterized protein YsxB (DUF464 family)